MTEKTGFETFLFISKNKYQIFVYDKNDLKNLYNEETKINDEIKEKKDLEKIILSDVQIEIYPEVEKSFLNLLHDSGYPNVKFEKKVDFEQLYNQRLN